MDKRVIAVFSFLFFGINVVCFWQVGTAYIYNTKVKFGALDIRIAKSATDYYYLQENQTFSFRESAPGVKTNTFLDMTDWDSSPYMEGNLREKTNTGDIFIMNYRLLIPDGYNPSFAEGYPLVMVLHGYGERANCEKDVCYFGDRDYSPVINDPPAPTDPELPLLNNDHNLLHGGKQHLAAMQKAAGKMPNDASLDPRAFPGFVLFPQNLNGWDNFTSQDAIRILRLIIKKYNVNPDRVYIEGISNGGQGMFECLKRAPWMFAAAIGMSATNDGFINLQGVAPSIAHIPLWLFQGGQDVTVYPFQTERNIHGFRSAGAVVRYTLYPELGHGTWNKAFAEPDFFPFLLGSNKADIHSFEGSTFICSDEGTRLEVAKGFLAYQWQLNGSVLAGADSAVFYAKQPGTYKVRFSRVSNPGEADWNQWSDGYALTVADPPVATVLQRGTLILKDLNGNTDAMLESPDPHTHYYWYKDGSLLDLPGLYDDTVQVVKLPASYGNGAYTLKVSDHGCMSAASEAKYALFNNSAPVNITDPGDFKGYSTSPSENTFSWKDASANESGFELWRRKKNNETQFDKWEMAGITGPNITTFADTTVDPNAVYQYKIRAVGNTGRSNYVPGGENEGIVVETLVDTKAPEPPAELKAVTRGVQKVYLTWRPATDDTRIREYSVRFNDDSVFTASTDTTFLLADIPPNRQYTITVRAVDVSGNFSAPSNTATASTYYSGLYYEHTTGSWTDLDSNDRSCSEFNGRVKEFTLEPKTQDDYFDFSFEGFLFIDNAGAYQFRTTSDDGSRLRLDNKLLVDNDGVHDLKTVTSAVTTLAHGAHRIRVEFFDYIEDDSLLVEYKGPDTGNNWAQVSRDVLKSDESVITGIEDESDNGPEDSFRVSVYPNPTTQDNVHVIVETVLPAPVQVSMLDPLGRDLFHGTFQPTEISQGISISPPGTMDTGLYVVVVTQGKLQVQRKIIVKR
jgi:predicted esterase